LSESIPRIWRFESFELDPIRFELRSDGQRVHVEPQVLSLLTLLVENGDRMVGKEEVIEKIWDGRIVSESAVAARIKAARKAVGDDGSQQRLIRTIHGRGFRFVGEVAPSGPAETAGGIAPRTAGPAQPDELERRNARDGRPSIAVLPFHIVGEAGPHDIVADALPADIIMDLSRLHWLFVIARGSSFRFRGADVDSVTVGRQLGVGYCLTGSVEIIGRGVTVAASLVDANDGVTIWGESYRGALSELQQMRPEIESQVVDALKVQIPRNEVRIARARPADELDAWASFHLGLDHMYRFTRQDNGRAAQLFMQSLARDPYFSRALGGLSFTHFQNAFLGFAEDPAAETEAARTLAHLALEADRIDPFAHFNIGRSLWLEGRLEDSIEWFDRAINISPSFAQGVYNRGLVGTMVGRLERADADLALALDLSPLDPLAYAMVSSRALLQVQLDDYEEAADLGARAATMPGAHKHIELIAAITAQLAGRREDAQHWLARACKEDPDLTSEVFFRSFPFAPTHAREVIERSLSELGI
jgi:TolB-like protein/Tfp pilus assembly protein PilF